MDTSALIAAAITLIGSVGTFFTTMLAIRKMLNEERKEKTKAKGDELKSSVDAASQVTNSALQVSEALRNELDDCYTKLDDQAAMRLQISEMRMAIGELVAKIAKVTEEETVEAPRCLVHRALLLNVQMELLALARPAAKTQPLRNRKDTDNAA